MDRKVSYISLGMSVATLVLVIFLIGKVDSNLSTEPAPQVGSKNVSTYGVTAPNSGDWTAFDNLLTGEIKLTSTSTFQAEASGIYAYRTVGGVDYADAQIDYSATSGVPCLFPNPFGNATTGILSFIAEKTSSLLGNNLFSLSTTSQALPQGSSTPALIYEHSVLSGEKDIVFWQPGLNASTTKATGTNFVFSDQKTGDGSSPYFLGPNDVLTWRNATGTPGSGNWSGTCAASFWKA